MFIKNLFTLIVFLSLSTTLIHAQTSSPEIPAPTPAGQPIPTVCVVASFGDPAKPGGPIWPSQNGTLIEGPDGNLYGTTSAGGKYGRGTVYKVTLQGEVIVIHDFDFTSGSQPKSSLALGPDGDLYGTTLGGGEKKVGTIFKISPNGGGADVIWSFKNGWLPKLPYPQKHPEQVIKNAWPSYPTAPLVLFNGGLYGVTTYTHNQKVGMLYSTGTGKDSLTSTYYFGDEKDKENPNKGVWPNSLVAGKDGKLYGTTYTGRTPDTVNGTIFVSGGGAIDTIHKFNFDDGSGPTGLMAASDGNIYGTTVLGGAGRNRRYGVIFRMELPSKKFTVLHKFNMADGAHPYSQMVEGDDGYLYGATRTGRGRHNEGVSGTIYRIHKDAPEYGRDAPGGESTSGGDLISRIMDSDLITRNAFAQNVSLSPPAQSDLKYKIVHKFKGPDGSGPVEGLMRHSNGKIYGTTAGGGVFNRGVVYVLNSQPTPFEKLYKPGQRWCCMLGQDFAPGLEGGALDPNTLSGHQYGRLIDITQSKMDILVQVARDQDPVGYVYTTHGGLVDIGHVRDMADMTKYVYDMLMAGETAFRLYEGAVQFDKTPDSQEKALELAGAVAYLEGWAHELTTWRMAQNNQHASSFSPEDLPSNMIGIEVAKRALRSGCCKDFNKAVDVEIAGMMKELGSQTKSNTDDLIDDMEGVWYEEYIKDPTVLLRRNFDGTVWLIPAGYTRAHLPYLKVSAYSQYFKEIKYGVYRQIPGREGKKVSLGNMATLTTEIKNEWIAEAGVGMASPP